jgi:hypothetical protein
VKFSLPGVITSRAAEVGLARVSSPSLTAKSLLSAYSCGYMYRKGQDQSCLPSCTTVAYSCLHPCRRIGNEINSRGNNSLYDPTFRLAISERLTIIHFVVFIPDFASEANIHIVTNLLPGNSSTNTSQQATIEAMSQ